jgi:quinol-cytochrome oxidoreductase complex cytochrome b subunit
MSLTSKRNRKKTKVNLRNPLFAGLFVLVLTVGLVVGLLGASLLPKTTPSTMMQTTAMPLSSARIVNLDVIPDWGERVMMRS